MGAPDSSPPTDPALPADQVGKQPKSAGIIDAVLNTGAKFWRSDEGEACVTLRVGGHIERHRVDSEEFGTTVRVLYGGSLSVSGQGRQARPLAAPKGSVDESIEAFKALALASKIVRSVGVRVIRDGDSLLLDLGCPDWKVVRITSSGWVIEVGADCGLLRGNGMKPLPEPIRSNSTLQDLRRILPVRSDNDLRLVVGFLLAVLWPEGPYPILAVDGEAGSGKSTFCRAVRRLVDPNQVDLRSMPPTEADLVIAACNSRIVAIDNLSTISEAKADVLCRLATGGGIGRRKLYTNSDEAISGVSRPVMFNGIPNLLYRPDLTDRAIMVTLERIQPEHRKTEAEFWREFADVAPGILGLLLDGIATAQRNLPTLQLASLPRMADFAHLICAAAPAFGWTSEDMLAALRAKQREAMEAAIEADPLASALRRLMQGKATWKGTASELLFHEALKSTRDESLSGWPKDAARLSKQLRRLAPALQAVGITFRHEREGGSGSRIIVLSHVPV